MLADGLRAYRGPLSASLWAEYQIDLERPPFGPLRLADFTVSLPPGCAFWRAVGGPMAWQSQQFELNAIEFRLRAIEYKMSGSHGQKPTMTKPPEYAGQKQLDQARNDARARRFRERFG